MKAVTQSVIVGLLVGGGYAAVAGQSVAPGGPAIRYVVSQRILAEAVDAKAEMSRFQSLQNERNGELRSKQLALGETIQLLARATDAAERTRLIQEEQRQRTDLERSTAQAQADLQALRSQIQASLQARVKAVLDELLKGQNVELVLNADAAVVWAAPGADLTNAVIERLNVGREAQPAASRD